ncbi:MAG: acyltransferase family protein [Acidobacteriaceae bacterium]
MRTGREADFIDCPWEPLRISVMVDMLPLQFKAKRRSKLGAAGPNHKPELDGIRGIALLTVMLSHGAGRYIPQTTFAAKLFAYALVPGWSGVELFFVLSGFLITGILLRSKSAENYFSSFYARRFLRIFPIYYFVVTVGLLAAHYNFWWNSVLPPERMRVAYYFYAQNWPIFWNHSAYQTVSVFGHFWSLAVEEQFYLVWPLVIWLLPEGWILSLCAAGLAIALPLRFYMVHRYAESLGAMVLTTSRMDGLLVGAMLAILLRRGQIPLRWIYLSLGLGAAILGYIAVFHHRELIDTRFYMPTLGITAFALLSGGFLALSQHRIPRLHHVLCVGWLRTVGKYSYGMYVYHVPLYLILEHILEARFGVVFPLPLRWALPYIATLVGTTFLIAKYSYDCFESKILALKVHFRPRTAATLGPASVAGAREIFKGLPIRVKLG